MSPAKNSTVRLRVSYSQPSKAIAEYTRSVGRGIVALQVRKPVPVGTRFIFELHAQGLVDPIIVEGEVLRVTPGVRDRHLLHVKYDAPKDRRGVDAALEAMFEAHKREKSRRFLRIPLSFQATDDSAYSVSYQVTNLAPGGYGAEVEAPDLPEWVRVGERSKLEIFLARGVSLSLAGNIAWTAHATRGNRLLVPSFGVRFGYMAPTQQTTLERMIQLLELPPAPWKARLYFGE